MRTGSTALVAAAVACALGLGAAPARASTALYTNAPCIYLLASNSASASAMLLCPTGTIGGSVTVPLYVKSSVFNVTAIAPNAFRDCPGLTGIALDASSQVASIGAGAFWGCTNLSTATLRVSVTDLGASAFLGCAALTNVNLNVATGLTAVAEQAFGGCSRLASITLPALVTNVGRSAFRDCVALTSIVLPSAATAIGDSAFQGCVRLASATFPGVTELGVNAFAYTALASVTIPAGLTNIAQGAFAGCTNLAAVTYSGSPSAVGSGAFKNCAALTSLPVPASVTTVASTAFDGCAGLTSVTLPAGVRDLSDNLFENCPSLLAVNAGGATNVGETAFANCAGLTNVTFTGNAPVADDTAFEGSEGVFVSYYKVTTGWKNLLAFRPTVMLGAGGAVEALSFAAWAVQNGLASIGGLSDAALAELFSQESALVGGFINGAVYAFGGNLTEDDQESLLRLTLADGAPVVVTPAMEDGAENFVASWVEGTTNLTAGVWDLTLDAVTLDDATRTGYAPSQAGGVPPSAFYRLKLTLGN